MITRNSFVRIAAAFALALVLNGPTALHAQSDNVRITVQLIEANGFEETDPAIGPVVNQLRQLFRFEGYRLMSEATMIARRPTVGEPTFAAQRIAPSDEDAFNLELQVWSRDESTDLRVDLSLFDQFVGQTVMEVGVNARLGQTIVLGSSQYRPDRPTLIVVFRMEELESR